MDRINQALAILTQYKAQNYHYLGSGFAGVVFHDTQFVYKVHISENLNLYGEINGVVLLENYKKKFKYSKHFHNSIEILKIDETIIIKYEYEKFDIVRYFSKEDFISFLAECWENKIIIKSIKKENFIRVDGRIKLIDYEIESYTDYLFLNMIIRAFIILETQNDNKISIFNKLKRSSINDTTILKDKKFKILIEKIFLKINNKTISPNYLNLLSFDYTSKLNLETLLWNLDKKKDIEDVVIPFNEIPNVNNLFFNLISKGYYIMSLCCSKLIIREDNSICPEFYFIKIKKIKPSPYKVSLIIKACPQDSSTLYQMVLHILRQISSPDLFYEKIITIDKKDSDYLRQYTDLGSLKELKIVCNQLIEDGLIDRIVEIENENEIIDTNNKWFNLHTTATHTIKGVPVTPQLKAFEEASGDYILQMDCDVLIGRKDYNHSFLTEMIHELEQNDKILSVGFNIYHKEGDKFVDYFGLENGGFVPEVRMGLFHKKRLLNLLPLSNEIVDGYFRLSWYRSLHEKQKHTNTVSIRGGNSKSFYIHPQNYRKTSKDVWFTILDRVEQGIIPDIQDKEFDLNGSYYDWCIQKREEDIVVVCIFKDLEYSDFIRTFESIKSQRNVNIGVILIDDCSSNGLGDFISHYIYGCREKITLIKNRSTEGLASNIYKSIHYFISNPDSILIILQNKDTFIGDNALSYIDINFKLYNSDLSAGKNLFVDNITLLTHYDFIDPKKNFSNGENQLVAFKKYLFDSLSIYDLKRKVDTVVSGNNFKKLNKQYVWQNDNFVLANIFVLLISLSENPIRMDYYNFISNHRIIVDRDNLVNQKVIIRERKSFLPNLNKIEVDITYDCNLKCFNCNRSCTQAPTKEQMTFEQIQIFIKESIEMNKKWELINILGGEPTLHKDFMNIINYILNEYIESFSNETILQITSNGYSQRTKAILSELPKHKNLAVDTASYKDSRDVIYFSAFNNAPIDDPKFKDSDFSKGCWVTSYCGISLNMYGYYVCSVSGGIDRVFNLKKGIKSLKNVDESIKNQLDTFCRYCGNYSDYAVNKGDFIPRNEKAPLKKEIISDSWLNIYKKWSAKK